MSHDIVPFTYNISCNVIDREVDRLNRRYRRRGRAIIYRDIRKEAKNRLVRKVKRRLHDQNVHLMRSIKREDRGDGSVDLEIVTQCRAQRMRASSALYTYGKKDHWRL